MRKTLAVAIMFLVCGCGDTREGLVSEGVTLVEEMAATLESVKDEASAKAANAKLEAITQKMAALDERSKKIAQPTDAESKVLSEKYDKRAQAAAEKVMQNMMRIGMDPTLRDHLDPAKLRPPKARS